MFLVVWTSLTSNVAGQPLSFHKLSNLYKEFKHTIKDYSRLIHISKIHKTTSSQVVLAEVVKMQPNAIVDFGPGVRVAIEKVLNHVKLQDQDTKALKDCMSSSSESLKKVEKVKALSTALGDLYFQK